ncbi:MAG: hypothetical protein RBS89_02145 [Candidatus Delongbacteria bacterium]|jgi:hypothetical protein|nr:hypothetical protein [Candidatus Delongbacteria bacterium]
MFKKMIKVLGLSLLSISLITACTDDEDPVVPADGQSEIPYLAMGNFTADGDSVIYTIDVTDEDTLSVYWIEAGTVSKADAEIVCSVYKKDGITPYKQIDNQKDFLDITNSAPTNAKRIAVEENEIVVKVKGITAGDYTLLSTSEKPYYFAKEDILADTLTVFDYTVPVGSAEYVYIFWEELDDNSGETADIQGSVYKMDGVTAYIQSDNNKPFVDKDNSSLDNPKPIQVDPLESSIKIHIERDVSNPVVGNFKVYVRETAVEW